MEFENLEILFCEACVVGAGAAGLNAADEMSARGVDVLVACDSLLGGTSLNSGSDKQTYYKLSLSGGAGDSVRSLAKSFFSGGGMHGDHAYAMAAASAGCFYKLVSLGVPFPHNEWGEFVGYRTDHDEVSRATSAGPLTSKWMAEALLKSVKARGVRFLSGAVLASILKDKGGAACGLLFLREGKWVAVCAPSIVLCTGGSALAYGHTAYPPVQAGACGAAVRAGAKMNNLCYWQYGLSSARVKWNVSGSYQQALPVYEADGEELFSLAGISPRDAVNAVFMKGYQWPFDARKMDGSSRVDLAVLGQMNAGRRVCLNFMRDLKGALGLLGTEARDYLNRCGALVDGPYERLRRINAQAIYFYDSHGIDLSKDRLEIALCAQHQNGGVAIDEWWQSSIPGLYAAGECAGAFGIYRPGGSALNETQVGSLRAARHISANRSVRPALSREEFLCAAGCEISAESSWLARAVRDSDGARNALIETRKEFSRCAGALRELSGMRALKARVDESLTALHSARLAAKTPEDAIIARDVLAFQSAALSAMLCQAEAAGEAGHAFSGRVLKEDAPDAKDFAFETTLGGTKTVPLRPLPEGGGWFERVWARFQEGEIVR